MKKLASPLTRISRSESKRETHSRLIFPALTMCALSFLTTPAFAQTWIGNNATTDWFDVGSWDTGVPMNGGNVIINPLVNGAFLTTGDSAFLNSVDVQSSLLLVGGGRVLYTDALTISGTGSVINNGTIWGNTIFPNTSMESSGIFYNLGTLTGNLNISAGTTTFDNAATQLFGSTTITGGVLNLDAVNYDGSGIGSQTIFVEGGTLNYDPSSSRVHTNNLVLDGGAVTYNSVGNNAQFIDGDVSVLSNSTINIAAAGVGGTGLIFRGDLSGSGDLNVTSISPGAGLVLTGSNATGYNGMITVTGNDNSGPGVGSGLALGDVGSKLAGSNLVINGTLELGDSASSMGWATNPVSGTTASIGALRGSGVVVGNMAAMASTRTLSVGNNDGDGTFSGSIVDGVNNTLSFIKNGFGTQVLSGDNNYTGTTTINAGTLQFATRDSLYDGNSGGGWTAANISVQGGATLALNVGGAFGFDTTDVTTLLTNLGGANGTSATGFAADSTIAFDTTDSFGDFTVSDNIADSSGAGGGAIGVSKIGTGQLVLSGNNTYTGATTVTEGSLRVTSDTALGSTVGDTTVSDGARLRLENVNIGAEALTINGNGNSNNGALGNFGISSYAGQITAATDATINAGGGILTLTGGLVKDGTTLTLTGGGNIFVNSVISGASANSDLIVDGVTVDLGAANTYNGPTYIRNSGVINANVFGALPNANNVPDRTRVIMDATGSGGSQLNLFAEQKIASLTGATSSLVNLNGNTLTIGQNTAPIATFAGVISGSGGLTKTRDNVQVLSGQNTYTGDTTIIEGTLRAGAASNGQAFGLNSAVIIDDQGNATLRLDDTNQTIGSLEGNGLVRLGSGILTTGGNDSDTTYSGVISDTGGLIKTGSGIFSLDNQNTYTGATTISVGTVEVLQNEALGTNAGDTTVANGASLLLNNVNYSTAEELTITGTGVLSGGALANIGTSTYAGQINVLNGASISAGGGDLTLTGGIVKNGTILTLTGGGTININTVGISGAAAGSDLIVDGVTVNLDVANTYYGPTYIRSTAFDTGILNANVSQALPSLSPATRSRVIMDDMGFGGSRLNLGSNQLIASLTGASTSLVDLNSNTLIIGQDGAPDATFAGVIDGSGGLEKRRDNIQILSGANTYTGATEVQNGTLRASGAATNGQAYGVDSAVTVNGLGILDLNSTNQTIGSLAGDASVTLGSGKLTTGSDGTSTIFSGVISGIGGRLTKVGNGTFTLSGNNTYTGETNIINGTLQLDGSTAATSTVAVKTNGTLSGNGTVLGNATLTGNGVINFGPFGNIAGTLDVTGGNWNGLGSVTGVVTASGALNVFTIGSGAVLTAPSGLNVTGGTIAAGDTLSEINGSINYTSNELSFFQGFISGNNTVTVNNELLNSGGGLVLQGANTYTGITTVTSGFLGVDGATATIGVNSNAIVSNTGTLGLTGGAVIDQIVDITGFGTQNFGATPWGAISAYGGTTSSVNGTINVVADASINAFAGSTLNLNAGVVKDGTDLTLTGGGIINVNSVISGTSLNSDLIVDSVTANLNAANTYNGPTFIRSTVGAGSGTLNANIAGAMPTPRSALTMDDSGLGASKFNLVTGNQSIASLTSATTGAASSLINLNANTLTIGVADAGVSTTFAGIISGTGGITKDLASTQTLTGVNTYSGATTINAGILAANSTNALGNSSATNTLVFNGTGTLRAIGNITSVATRTVTMTTTGIIDTNGFDVSIAGVISGTNNVGGLTKNGTGNLILSGTNTYNGPTTVNAGTLRAGLLAGGQAFGNLSAVTLANVANTTLDLNGFSQTIGSLAGGGLTGGNVTLGNGTLTTGGNGTSTTFAGIINANGGTGGLTKNGAGIFTLTGLNTYTGATTVNAGTLRAGVATQAFGIGSAVSLANVANTTLDLAGFNQTIGSLAGGGLTGGNVTLGNGTLTTGGNGTSTTFAGIINANGGTGGLTKQGAGVFTLSGLNTYTGATTVNAGTLRAGVATQAFGIGSAVSLANVANTTLDLNGFNQTIGSLAGGGATGGNVTLGTAILTTGDANNTTFAGVISGSGGIIKNGSGIFTLSGDNAYTGTTTLNAGTLVLSAAERLANTSDLVINGGELTFVNTETVDIFTQNGGILDFDVTHPGALAPGVCQLTAGFHNDVLITTTANLGGTINVDKGGAVEFQRGQSALLINSSNLIGTPDFFNHDYTNRMFLVVDSVTTDDVTLLGTGITGQNGNLSGIAGLTANQKIIANVINTNIAGNGNILDTTVEMDQIALLALGDCNSAPGAGLNLLSPESYAGFADYGVQTIKSYTTNALSMPAYSRDGSARSVRIPVGTASEPMVSAPSSDAVTSVFAGYSHYSTGTETSLNGADYDISSNGGILGVRHEVNRLTLGGFIAVDEGDINSATLNADAEAFLVGAIASYMIKPEMNLMVTGGITYGSYEFSGTRQSLGLVSFDEVNSDVYDVHVAIEGDTYSTDKIRVTPFLGLHYINSETEAFNEVGLGALAMTAHDYDALFTEIGIKSEYQVNDRFSVNGNLSYTHNLSGSDKNIGASLGGTPFAVSSPGLGNDFFTIGLGAQFQVTEAIRLGINYRAELSTDAEMANGVHIGGSYSF